MSSVVSTEGSGMCLPIGPTHQTDRYFHHCRTSSVGLTPNFSFQICRAEDFILNGIDLIRFSKIDSAVSLDSPLSLGLITEMIRSINSTSSSLVFGSDLSNNANANGSNTPSVSRLFFRSKFIKAAFVWDPKWPSTVKLELDILLSNSCSLETSLPLFPSCRILDPNSP